MAEYNGKLLKGLFTKARNVLFEDNTCPFNYSTTEHIIGKWIDGSTLYEKTINYGSMPNNDRVLIDHNISNLAAIYEIRAIAVGSGGYFSIPTANPTAANASVNVEASTTQVGIRTGRDFSSYNAYITLRYTKTS